jgi:hypothetical protein
MRHDNLRKALINSGNIAMTKDGYLDKKCRVKNVMNERTNYKSLQVFMLFLCKLFEVHDFDHLGH